MMELLTPLEIARMLKVSKECLRLMRKQGEGPPWIKISPKIIRYEEEEVRKWLRENKNGTLQTRKSVVVQIPSARP